MAKITSAQPKAAVEPPSKAISKANKVLVGGTIQHKAGCGGNHIGAC